MEGEGPDKGGDDGFSADDFPGRDLFASGDPMKILARLHTDDPLELWPRCAEWISQQSVLMQPDRLYLRVVARLAYAGPAYRGKPPLNAWIAERMAVSLRELLSDDLQEERRELPIGLEEDPRYVFLSKTLGIEIGLAPRVQPPQSPAARATLRVCRGADSRKWHPGLREHERSDARASEGPAPTRDPRDRDPQGRRSPSLRMGKRGPTGGQR